MQRVNSVPGYTVWFHCTATEATSEKMQLLLFLMRTFIRLVIDFFSHFIIFFSVMRACLLAFFLLLSLLSFYFFFFNYVMVSLHILYVYKSPTLQSPPIHRGESGALSPLRAEKSEKIKAMRCCPKGFHALRICKNVCTRSLWFFFFFFCRYKNILISNVIHIFKEIIVLFG